MQEFVIFLSLALGAESITVASAPKKLDNFDFIIIRDNTPVPPELEELDEGTVVDEEWVKQSAIVGCQVRPSSVLSYAVQKRWPKADERSLCWDYAGRTKPLEAGPGSEDGSKESVIQAVVVAASYSAFASFPFSTFEIDLAMDIVTSLRANFELLEQAGRRN